MWCYAFNRYHHTYRSIICFHSPKTDGLCTSSWNGVYFSERWVNLIYNSLKNLTRQLKAAYPDTLGMVHQFQAVRFRYQLPRSDSLAPRRCMNSGCSTYQDPSRACHRQRSNVRTCAVHKIVRSNGLQFKWYLHQFQDYYPSLWRRSVSPNRTMCPARSNDIRHRGASDVWKGYTMRFIWSLSRLLFAYRYLWWNELWC